MGSWGRSSPEAGSSAGLPPRSAPPSTLYIFSTPTPQLLSTQGWALAPVCSTSSAPLGLSLELLPGVPSVPQLGPKAIYKLSSGLQLFVLPLSPCFTSHRATTRDNQNELQIAL